MIFVVLRGLDLKINYSIYFNSDLAIASLQHNTHKAAEKKKKHFQKQKYTIWKKILVLLVKSIKFKSKAAEWEKSSFRSCR